MNVECHGDQYTTWDHEKRIKNQRDTSKEKIRKNKRKNAAKEDGKAIGFRRETLARRFK